MLKNGAPGKIRIADPQITHNVLFRIEYTHFDFGTDGYDLENIGGLPVDVDSEIDTLKVGISYKF